MAVGFLSLPTELLCHILLLLRPSDLCRCATTCKIIWNAARNSVAIQYKLELHAQGFETTTRLDSISVSKRMRSLKKLASLWRSDFHAKTIWKTRVDSNDYRQWKCGIWSSYNATDKNLHFRDWNTGVELVREVPIHNIYEGYDLDTVVVDPLQDLVVSLFISRFFIEDVVIDVRQDYDAFLIEFRSISSQLPHLESGRASLEFKHAFAPGHYSFGIWHQPAICGDRVVFLYCCYSDDETTLFIQVIDWRKGYAKRYPLSDFSQCWARFHLVDEQTIVFAVIDEGLFVYTLRQPDGSPQHRITYLFPDWHYNARATYCAIHVTPSFSGTAARPHILVDYVPSLESQIMVLEPRSRLTHVFVVVNMVIFSEQAIHSETPVEIPWSNWGPQYTCCFPHTSNPISVFGSKMAYVLPVDYTPSPGERLESIRFDNDGHFYVHIWDFNQRVITRAENIQDRNALDPLIRRPGCLGRAFEVPFNEDITSHLRYTATVCRTPFTTKDFVTLFLDQDRLVLVWTPESMPESSVIQVVCPVVDEDVA